MRTVPAALAALTLTIGVAGPALAHPASELIPPLTVDLTHAATDNVAFEARFHEHFGSAGGTVASNDSYLDDEGAPIEFYVVTDGRGVYTYDISSPKLPVLLDMLVLRQATAGIDQSAQEDPSTDGSTLLVGGNPSQLGGSNTLHILSIDDPTDIQIISSWTGDDHTWSCISDVATGDGCAYAYGRSNNIIDIRDRSNPTKLDVGWKQAIGVMGTGNGGLDYTHDMTEVRPGLVMSAGAQPVLMDTTDPAAPVALVQTTLFDHVSPNDTKFDPAREWSTFGYHSVEWPNGGTDSFVIMGTEIGAQGGDCTDDEAIIETWDARPVRDALAEMDELITEGSPRADARTQIFGDDAAKVDFIRLDAYQAAERGIFLTGQALASEGYCAHWMEHERGWQDGGRLAVGFYNRGARFVEVDAEGMMSEIGWFTGADAYTGSVQWVTDEVVYVHDYRRGLDVLTITSEAATGTYTGTGSVADSAMTVAQLTSAGLLPAPDPASPLRAPLVLVGAGLLLCAAVARRQRT
ncbi:MAG: hypothetical protein ACI9OB_000300 [Nonlabens sp.]